MNAETLKAAATYLVSGVVVVGGLFILYQTRLETAAEELRLVISGFIGATLAFLFGQETQTRTARQTVTATQASTPSSMTVTAGPPASATVTPAPATDETAP